MAHAWSIILIFIALFQLSLSFSPRFNAIRRVANINPYGSRLQEYKKDSLLVLRSSPLTAGAEWSPSVTALSSANGKVGKDPSPRAPQIPVIISEKSKELRDISLKFLIKLKNLLVGNGFTDTVGGGENKFSKQALAGLGLNALLAYGFVSNVSYITCLILSWVSHGKLTGMSPLAPGQRKQFLAIYGGFWVTNNILRPLRFSLSLILTPFFNKLVDLVQSKTGFKRATSTGIVVFLVNVCGTITYLVLGLLLATSITGVPLRP